MSQEQRRPRPQPEPRGANVNSTLSVIVAVLSVLLGFFILRDIRGDGGGTVSAPAVTETTVAEGSVDTLSVGEAPDEVVKTALKAANLIGDGLYGVDLKQVGQKCYVIEVNDNPNIDSGYEDQVLKDAIYREIMGVFLKRIDNKKRGLNS